MKFVLANDRPPTGTGYRREIGTGLFCCDHDCYADHCKSAAQALANLAGTSLDFLASSQMKARSETWRPKKTSVCPQSSDHRRCDHEIC
jgi:hypothetical protein